MDKMFAISYLQSIVNGSYYPCSGIGCYCNEQRQIMDAVTLVGAKDLDVYVPGWEQHRHISKYAVMADYN
jgi:hypothetical protein